MRIERLKFKTKVYLTNHCFISTFFYYYFSCSLIPHKLMHDWKELFMNGKPIYEQASIKYLPPKPSAEQRIELEKRDLLDNSDYEEYKVQTNM